jgi:hypothetical protein
MTIVYLVFRQRDFFSDNGALNIIFYLLQDFSRELAFAFAKLRHSWYFTCSLGIQWFFSSLPLDIAKFAAAYVTQFVLVFFLFKILI